MSYLTKLDQYSKARKLTPSSALILKQFYVSYSEAVQSIGKEIQLYEPILEKYLDRVLHQIEKPFVFDSFHQCIREPFDYYNLGLELIRPLILFDLSKVSHLEYVDQMERQLAAGENVVLFANHQTEPDPQVISLLLEKTHPRFAENMIFVAGHRVISDPLAIPLSMGRNLLCIFSKKYVANPPEKRQEKLQHNQKTMKKMGQLLAEGGRCIYVAPSGGRDRPNKEGKVEVAHFDPQSIEMFYLMSQQSEHPTHFYPLTLVTYDLLPPPNRIQKELGEGRHAKCTPVQLAFNKEIEMNVFPGSETSDKKVKRQLRAEYIWSLVKKDYQAING
jgi:glycerol-3-phosphate O-acyltransferase